MIDIKLVREKFKEVKENLAGRGDNSTELLEQLKVKDEQWRKLKQDADYLRAERNKTSEEINKAKKQGRNIEVLVAKAKEIPAKLQKIEQEERKLQDEIRNLLLQIPNLLDKSVPYGKNETGNKVIKKFGKTKKSKISHHEIIEKLELADVERAGKVSGARFYYLKNDLVRLDYAIVCFALDLLRKKGFILIQPPYMIKREAYEGAIVLKDFEDVIYKIQDEDLYMIATAEHALACLHMNEILNLDKPLNYAAFSACFRKEAGTHGKDTKGIFRVHQFNKVEQFIFCKPEDSWKIHEEITKNSEELFKKLKIPFRTVLLCSGDTGKVSSKTYDLEVWLPGQNKYREEGSSSNCLDYQARRLNIKYEKNGKREFCHTLNNTMIATPRALIAILENNLQKDGSIKIPNVLVKYMNGQKKIVPVKKTSKKISKKVKKTKQKKRK